MAFAEHGFGRAMQTPNLEDAGTNAVAARHIFTIGNDRKVCARRASKPIIRADGSNPCARIEALKHEKGIWWMPWHREAMKDVALCEKLRGGESNL